MSANLRSPSTFGRRTLESLFATGSVVVCLLAPTTVHAAPPNGGEQAGNAAAAAQWRETTDGQPVHEPHTFDLKIRVAPPVVGGTVFPLGSESTVESLTLVGGSATMEIAEWVAIDAGGAYETVIFGDGGQGYVRAGLAPVVLDDREAEGDGWTLQPEALLGYRYSTLTHHPFNLDFDGTGSSESKQRDWTSAAHQASLTVGIDATYYAAEYIGWTMRAQLTAAVTADEARSSNAPSSDGSDRAAVMMEPGMSVGLAF